MWVAFAKATHIFSAKNIRILYIESAKTVNVMTLNELVKLTTLWTTGPRFFFNVQVQGQIPHQWAPFQVAAGLLHTWQISHQTSRCVYHEGRQPRASTLCDPSHVILGLRGPCFPSTCMSQPDLTAPLEHSICPYQQSLLSFRMRSRTSMHAVHYENTPIQIYWKFYNQKRKIFR